MEKQFQYLSDGSAATGITEIELKCKAGYVLGEKKVTGITPGKK